MSNKSANIIAAILISTMGLMSFLSILNDSFTFDETAHVAAGYSYLTQKDMRLNPEHPPLIKDISALPLLFLKPNFPENDALWQNAAPGRWWDQFDVASLFLYRSGNNPGQILFWSRTPIILMTLLLGFYVFRWTKELFGNKAGVIALLLFSFSPTILAHGRLVTTDVGAAAAVLIATYYFVKFLRESSAKNLIKAGIFLGVAELTKFSAILLFPFFGILIFFWVLIKSPGLVNFLKSFFRYISLFILILTVSYAVVWLVYLFHTWNYPVEKQISDSKLILASAKSNFLPDAVVWMIRTPVLKPVAHYLLGLFMVLQRTSGGNTSYFMGEISAAGWKTYFPTVYLVKEPLAFFVLMVASLLAIFWMIKKPFWKNPKERIADWTRAHFPELAMLLFIGIYWLTSLRSNLNIGVRHLLPIFPFTIILVSYIISKLIVQPYVRLRILALGAILLWQALSVISVYPSFLSYFNELAGGPDNGYKIVVDSNLDWGQDLKRLAKWTSENNVNKIYVDYFGGGDLRYYLDDKFLPWWGQRNPNEIPYGSYLAVSATLLQGGRAKPGAGFSEPTGYYLWLNNKKLITKIGYSIFVYKIE